MQAVQATETDETPDRNLVLDDSLHYRMRQAPLETAATRQRFTEAVEEFSWPRPFTKK